MFDQAAMSSLVNYCNGLTGVTFARFSQVSGGKGLMRARKVRTSHARLNER